MKSLDDALLVLKLATENAILKHPDPNPNLICLMEEVGEIAKAHLEENRDQVKAEAMDAAVCAMRIYLEGV